MVVGSAQSKANGRKSTALGFNATVRGDHSGAFSFNGAGCSVAFDEPNTIRFCADTLAYNGVSFADVLAGASEKTRARRLLLRNAAANGGGHGDRIVADGDDDDDNDNDNDNSDNDDDRRLPGWMDGDMYL